MLRQYYVHCLASHHSSLAQRRHLPVPRFKYVLIVSYIIYYNPSTSVCFNYMLLLSVRLEPDHLRLTQPVRTGKIGCHLANYPSVSLPFLHLSGWCGSTCCLCDVISRLCTPVRFLPTGPKYLQEHHLQTGNTSPGC